MRNTPNVLINLFIPLLSKKLITGLNINAINIEIDINNIRFDIIKRMIADIIIAVIINDINNALFLKSFCI